MQLGTFVDNCSHQASTCLDHLIWLQECRMKAINLHQYIHCLHTNLKFDLIRVINDHFAIWINWLVHFEPSMPPWSSHFLAICTTAVSYLKVAARSSYWKNKRIITKSKSELAYKIFHSLVGASFDDLIFENHANSLVDLHKYRQFLTNGLNIISPSQWYRHLQI